MSVPLLACARPCANCPWRTDAAPGEFAADKYRELAATARDMATAVFTCHKTPTGRERVCAGFLERGADHNLAVRLAYSGKRLEFTDRSGGLDLHPNYRAMAEANGVDPSDPELWDVR